MWRASGCYYFCRRKGQQTMHDLKCQKIYELFWIGRFTSSIRESTTKLCRHPQNQNPSPRAHDYSAIAIRLKRGPPLARAPSLPPSRVSRWQALDGGRSWEYRACRHPGPSGKAFSSGSCPGVKTISGPSSSRTLTSSGKRGTPPPPLPGRSAIGGLEPKWGAYKTWGKEEEKNKAWGDKDNTTFPYPTGKT